MSSPAMSLRERQKLLTREHLLATAEELFGTKGFAETSIEDLLQSAGVSRATLYAHFEGKNGLLTGIIERMYDDAQRQFAGFAALPDWTVPSIEIWLRSAAADRLRTASRHRSTLAAAPTFFLSTVETRTRFRTLIATVRQPADRWSHLDPTEADLRARLVVNIVEQQFYDLATTDRQTLDLDRFVTHTARAIAALVG